MQKHYWQILINGEPWHNQKIWNYRSAIAVYKKVKSDLERHVDYKGETIELARFDGRYEMWRMYNHE